MNPCAAILLVSLLLIGHSADAAILEANGSYQNCRCMKHTSDFIHPKKYESIEIIPLGGACRTTEIINGRTKIPHEIALVVSCMDQETLEIVPNSLRLKLKKGPKVCVNPNAPWMKKVLSNLQSQFIINKVNSERNKELFRKMNRSLYNF